MPRRTEILGAVKNPLVFFALALLTAESAMSYVACAQMEGSYQFWCVVIMALLFLAVLGTVAVITIKWPTHLYAVIDNDLKENKRLRDFVNTKAFDEAVEKICRRTISQAQAEGGGDAY